MKIHSQSSEPLERLAAALEGQRVTMMTLLEPPGRLGSRPMTPLEMDDRGALWFMASKEALGSIIEPRGSIVNLAFSQPDDSDFVSLSGVAELVDDAQRRQELWSLAARPWFDGPQDPDLALVRVTPHRAEIWDGPDNVVSRVLAMAASVVAGHEVGLGHKDVLDTLTPS